MQHYPDLREFVRARDHVVCDTPMASHLDLRPQAAAVHFPLRVMGELWGVFVAEFDLSLRTLTTGQLETLATFADFVRNQVERSVAEEHRLDQLRGVLHNARKPVNAAIALADWLRRLPPGEERDTIIDTMIGGLKLAATKLHSLAAVWHGLHQHSTYARFVRCDLVQTARVALDLFAPRAADAGVALVIAPPDGEAVVDTDSDVLQVILMELIDNSLCWFPRLTSKKRIVVEIRPCPSDGAWDMLVHDNGSGFTEHALEHAFELKPSTRASSGLGLPGAALAARSLGAELQILRQPRFSPGASVCLHLPTGVRHD